MLYDPTKKSGFVYNALRYATRKRKANGRIDLNVSEAALMTDAEKKEVQDFFKRCVLPKQRKDVEARMTDTKAYRREMIIDDFDDYKKMWDFYFAVPDLVGLYRTHHFF